ncbi:MAG: Epoxide hydrolase [uncultured Sphingomonas sp.]|uniref:Epoxide hydrolase n=1 Tax=uncultured Sphingomonas sp. TaxID=158754 RepID=A0A6J4SVA7_9SPHN|nr:alpha/beta fold hydrolase [uncultured Sphingomonas sp.]CAA9506261.1 MAG: Epoxide hydrolase [uncultured Sphingomonas sp.]
MTEFRRLPLSTGVTLNVAVAGPEDAPPVILLHGFPESHRTWRGIAPLLQDRFRLVMPDQRGFGGSDRPQAVDEYRTDKIAADLFALADGLGIERFSLVGHDWGGAVAWAAAIKGDPRLERLGIVNAPHPLIFQKSLVESTEQRAASQYMTAFRTPGFEQAVEAMGLETFFEKSFSPHVDLSLIPPQERAQYVAEWSQPGALTAMLNWYRASHIHVPPPLLTVPVPDWVLGAFPKVRVPTLVVWGMRDKALLPVQLDGLDRLVEDLQIVRIPDAGHFVPWEKPEAVAAALGPFLAGEAGA